MSPIYDLSPANSAVNINEDVRSPLTPVNNSPFTVGTSPTLVLPANENRAIASIFNAGTATAFLREGSSPVSSTNYNHPLPSNRLWEPDSNFRFRGQVQAITAAGTTILQVSESIILL